MPRSGKEHWAQHDVADTIELRRPHDAIDLVASDDGDFVNIDTGGTGARRGDS